MIVWRLCKERYADQPLNGEGARLYGGRWNYAGIPVVYTAGSLALSALEFLVNIDHDIAPDDIICVKIEVPSKVSIEQIDIDRLPDNWRVYPSPESLREIGSKWAKESRSLILEVPSSVVPQESNYLLNPNHKEFKMINIENKEPFQFDPRFFE